QGVSGGAWTHHATSSVAPISGFDIGAPCVLAWRLQSLARNARPLLEGALVRIAFDVSPLSHPRTGVGNYIRGSLAGLVEAAGGEDEVVAFAPTSPQGLHAIPRAVEGIPVDLKLRFVPFAHLWRQGWSRLGWPPV